MVRIAISKAAFGAIAATMAPGSYDAEIDAKGERFIWLPRAVADRLWSLREPGEGYSEVILRLVEMEAEGDA